MYTVAIYLKDIGTYPNFYDAFKAFYDAILAEVKQGTALQAIETACWIEHNKEPLYWNQARDLAYKLGVLKNKGEFQDLPTNQRIPVETFEAFWQLAQLENEVKLLEELSNIFKELSITVGDLDTAIKSAEEASQ